ncbi:MAG: hypothetical protein K2Z81_16575, partial [Cyanobacteria bacterium]|nr:hypothetical protein [Cyanobacteriota bacterium]
MIAFVWMFTERKVRQLIYCRRIRLSNKTRFGLDLPKLSSCLLITKSEEQLKMQIHQLPNHIFFIIRDFVFNPDRMTIHQPVDGELFSASVSLFGSVVLRASFKDATPASWRNFLNTSKQYFSEVKRLTGYYDLKESVGAAMMNLPSTGLGFFASQSPTTGKIEQILDLELMSLHQQVDFALSLNVRSLPSTFMVRASFSSGASSG